MAHLSYKHFTLGIEEEYMVIDPKTRELKSHEQKIVTEGHKVIKDKVKAEMHQAVVEVGTDICQNIAGSGKKQSHLWFACACGNGRQEDGNTYCQLCEIFSSACVCVKY